MGRLRGWRPNLCVYAGLSCEQVVVHQPPYGATGNIETQWQVLGILLLRTFTVLSNAHSVVAG